MPWRLNLRFACIKADGEPYFLTFSQYMRMESSHFVVFSDLVPCSNVFVERLHIFLRPLLSQTRSLLIGGLASEDVHDAHHQQGPAYSLC